MTIITCVLYIIHIESPLLFDIGLLTHKTGLLTRYIVQMHNKATLI